MAPGRRALQRLGCDYAERLEASNRERTPSHSERARPSAVLDLCWRNGGCYSGRSFCWQWWRVNCTAISGRNSGTCRVAMTVAVACPDMSYQVSYCPNLPCNGAMVAALMGWRCSVHTPSSATILIESVEIGDRPPEAGMRVANRDAGQWTVTVVQFPR
jgi:hypothetical protein